jgi:hypothetical protein
VLIIATSTRASPLTGSPAAGIIGIIEARECHSLIVVSAHAGTHAVFYGTGTWVDTFGDHRGRFRVSFSTDNEYYEVGGVYREVVPNERLVFSWAWYSTPERESLVTVSLKPDGDGTLLTLHHEQLFDQAARDGHERGWVGALDKLEKYLA